MTHRTFRTGRRWLSAGGLALGLALAPACLDPQGFDLTVKAALAKGGNGNGGGGGGGHGGGDKGGGRDSAERGGGHGRGHGKAFGGGGGHHGRSYGSLDDFAHEMRGSRGRSELGAARGRYDDALGRAGGRGAGAGIGAARKAADLSPEETRALMERGWQSRKHAADGFRNHGERVSTMVELAKALGYGARVGALQGNFGTPFENGIADLQADIDAIGQELASAREALAVEEDQARRAELEATIEALEERASNLETELDRAVAAAKPGKGPDASWATADLDVNDDGVVDRADLEALESAPTAPTSGHGS